MACRLVALFAFAWLLVGVDSRVRAQVDRDAPEDPDALAVHAFVSQGFLVTTDNNYLADSSHGSFEFTEVGINFTKPLSDDLRVGIQLFARDLGPIGNYQAQLDWFYLDYRWANWLGFRAGRVKLPFGLYNEINDVDAARAFVLLPQSIYPTQQRDYLLAQTGVELYGYVDLEGAGALDYRLYGGTVFLEKPDVAPGSPFEISDIRIPYVAGGRLLWETPLAGLRAGGGVQFLQLDFDLRFDPQLWTPLQMAGSVPADFDGIVEADLPVTLWIASVEYAANDLLVAAEYSRWSGEVESSVPELVEEDATTAERMYVMAAYRLSPWLQPGAYYALHFANIHDRNRRSTHQHDTAVVVRVDLNEHWLVKLEAHYMHGTAALRPELNDGVSKAELEPNWLLFMAKTTAYF